MRFLLDKPWLVFMTVCIALFTSALLGYRLALSTRINEDSHITGLREGLFILLGLLLGFTVAMVLPRFDQRSQLVVDEANAIGTTIPSGRLLPRTLLPYRRCPAAARFRRQSTTQSAELSSSGFTQSTTTEPEPQSSKPSNARRRFG